MDCKAFEARLEELLDGSLSAGDQHSAEEHAARCDACRELLELARGDLELLADAAHSVGAAPDLTGAILARTSGSPCGSAQQQLCDMADSLLAAPENQLVALHLEHCTRCTALFETLRWLQPVLLEMALIEPDARLVSDVLAATSASRPRRRELRARLRAWCGQLVQRPRFAWEVAYAGTLIVVLLCGTPHSPLRAAPSRALAFIEVLPADASAEVSTHGGRVLQALREPVTGRVHELGSEFAAQHRDLATGLGDLHTHSGLLWQAMLRRDFMRSSLLLSEIGNDLKRCWQHSDSAPKR